ncbi:heterokaryon incompatibility protein [Colletotrichum tamarilloi]|uniref:Heterokaryon incompatibility protein n=1 Tax=Colletotrichum tamarilloi TaxID=1209934 RepID=A0ABQ9RAR2_9PEZI|nr:heterokaryon incompatibility protein [Colletotrichum tamarilloi]KAK1499791.1 heterokaryon incompatibility protein [Colletotrichum tamarilloi]
MTESLADYQYQALSTIDSIRLLSVSQDDNHPHGLCLSLKEVNLDDEPIFAALSYTWQLPKYSNSEQTQEPGPGKTFDVVCDGRSMEISENLFDFLRTILDYRCLSGTKADRASSTTRKCLSKVRTALETMPLWIDAFCINQANSEEKKHQVLLMHRIYSSAQNVLVWLGLSEPSSEVQWIHDRFIPRLSQARKKSETMKKLLQEDHYCRKPEVLDQLGYDTCSRWATSWFIFAKFLRENRWFDRGWVVQEVALADPAQIHIMCGTAVLNWKRLGAFIQFLHEARWSHSLETHIERSFEHVKLISEIQCFKKPRGLSSRHLGIGGGLHKINGVRPLLAELVYYTKIEGWNTKSESAWLACASFIISTLRSFQFGDDRDHIHGCLGMLSMLLPQGFPSPIIPDYDRSVEDVFTSVAACFLQRLPLLSELRQVGKEKSRRNTKLPSWVPDYSVPNLTKIDRHKRLDVSTKTEASLDVLEEHERMIWRYHPRRPSVIGHKLVLYGVRLGTTMGKVHDLFTPESSYEMALTMVSFFRARPFEALCRPQLNIWNRLAAAVLNECLELYNLHLQPMTPGHCLTHQTVDYYVPGRREFVHKRLNGSVVGALIQNEIYEWVKIFESNFGSKSPRSPLRPCPLHVDTKVWEELENECFYHTSRGSFGLGSPSSVPNDQIWLAEGASVPFVLREVIPVPKTGQEDSQPREFRYVGDIELSHLDIYSSHFTLEQHRSRYKKINII